MPKLTVIGCSSGYPHPHQACSSYLIESGSSAVLFDIGEGATAAMRRIGITPAKINAIVISHMHADHVMGLPLFVQTNYILRRSTPLTVYAPGEAIAGLKRLFDLTYLYPLKVGFPIKFVTVKARASEPIGKLAVRALPNSHLQRHREIVRRLGKPNRAESYSFEISIGRRRVVYSADLGGIEELREAIVGADILMIEASHVDFTELGEILKESPATRVVITHADDDFEFVAARKRLRSQGVKQVDLASEGMIIAL